MAVSGVGEAHLRRLGTSLADLSEVAGRRAARARPGREPFSLPEAMRLFDELERTRGPLAKGERLARRPSPG